MTDDERLRVLVWHIRDVAGEIADFVATSTQADVRSNVFLERGLVHSLYIVADLATRLQNEHPAFIASLPDVACETSAACATASRTATSRLTTT